MTALGHGLAFNVLRREAWILDNLTLRKASNCVLALAAFVLRRSTLAAAPVMLKVDVSPACTLACTVCVHAAPHGRSALEEQDLAPAQRMTTEQFRSIVSEVAGRTCAASLYYVGDPYAVARIDDYCRIAREAGLNVHLSTHFSYNFSDERIRRIVSSGVTHLTVCVDGLSQEKYERTRVGGRIDWVLSNLRRVLEARSEAGSRWPKIEVQYIKFAHNVDEVEAARERLEALGIDLFTEYWGALHNYTDHSSDTFEVLGPRSPGALPRCTWPHLATLVRYDGEIIPCCNFRQGEQYQRGRDIRSLGNAFRHGLLGVWNSPAYRAARRLVSRPARAASEPDLHHHFCNGCPVLYETTVGRSHRWAPEATWEATQLPIIERNATLAARGST